jgi:hypothetical protein
MDLTKKISNLNEGLTIYSQLLKDEETILIPFAISQYVTVSRICELLPEYLADLQRNECKESLCIDFDQLTNMDYWMKKLVKLKSDMERLGTVPMKEHGFVVTILGFSPETTMDLYRAIERLIIDMVKMLEQVEATLKAAPPVLYQNFYRHLRAQYCEELAVKDFGDWLMYSGKMSLCKLKSLRAKVIADYVNSGILRCCLKPSGEERSQVDLGALKKHLPDTFHYEEWFDNCYAVFCRTISWKGDILVPDYACAGLFIFQHWSRLTESDIQAIFHLDKMLELIHEDIKKLPQEDKKKEELSATLPMALATPEAMILWKKAQDAGYVDEHYQPLLSRTEAALLADVMAEKLGIKEKWKVFEAIWSRNNMRNDYNDALNQQKTRKILEHLKKTFSD